MWAQGHPSTLRAVSTFIRGQRVNLAAAICWENFMPLLRQSLYAQNINLYLAPTADQRDTWLPLMRTIGIEGRCFVVTSNMCTRGEADTAGTGDRDVVPVAGAARPGRGSVSGAARKSSTVITDDSGHEFVLPPSPSKVRHGRRKSVFDEDGNEIVLSCPADNGENQEQQQKEQQQQQQQQQKQQQKQQKQLPKVQEQAQETPRVNQSTAPAFKSPFFVSRGGSAIVSPFGDVLAGPQWEDEDSLIYADIDLRDCIRGRLDLDAAGSYSRNDAFKLTVDGLDMDPLPY